MLYAIMFHLGVGFILALIFYRLFQTAWFKDVSDNKETAAFWCWFIGKAQFQFLSCLPS